MSVERAAAVREIAHHPVDDRPGVRQRFAHAGDELGVGDVTALGGGQQVGRDVQRHAFPSDGSDNSSAHLVGNDFQ
jgi:hypothetical protein